MKKSTHLEEMIKEAFHLVEVMRRSTHQGEAMKGSTHQREEIKRSTHYGCKEWLLLVVICRYLRLFSLKLSDP